jgi:hypothetical protein
MNREVCLSWRDRRGDHLVRARLLDVSKFGMLVESETGIPTGVVVSVGTDATPFGRACVRHCAPSGPNYRIGLHTPDHMTSLMASVDSPLGGARS